MYKTDDGGGMCFPYPGPGQTRKGQKKKTGEERKEGRKEKRVRTLTRVVPRVTGSFIDSRRTTVDISSDSGYLYIYISTAYTVIALRAHTCMHVRPYVASRCV